MVAPGGSGLDCSLDVLATWPEDLDGYCGYEGYNAIAGTSMATPHVAGVAAHYLHIDKKLTRAALLFATTLANRTSRP